MATSATRKTAATKAKPANKTAVPMPAVKTAPSPALRRKAVKVAAAAPVPAARVPAPSAPSQPVRKAVKVADKAVEKGAVKTAAKAAPAPGKVAVKNKDATKPREKAKKLKMVRDSFTMPEPEYKVLGEVKRACLKSGVEVKKSELLRVGVAMLQKLSVDDLKASLAALAPVKAGRPKAGK